MADDDKPTTTPTTALAPIEVAIGGIPKTVGQTWRLSQLLAKSEMVPKHFRDRPQEIFAVIQQGAETGVPPMAALQTWGMINGRPDPYGDGLLGMIVCSPHYREHDEYFLVGGKRVSTIPDAAYSDNDTAAVCTFVRRGKASPVTRIFSIAQAKRAKLWTKPGPWQEYPDRMLQMRARKFAARDTFPDLLRGVRGLDDGDIVADIEPPSAPPVVRRLSEQAPNLEPDTAEGTQYADGFKSRSDD